VVLDGNTIWLIAGNDAELLGLELDKIEINKNKL